MIAQSRPLRGASIVAIPGSLARRRTSIWVGMSLAIGILAVVSLSSGELPIPPGEVLGVLAGSVDGPSAVIVLEWRLPRVVLGVMLGASLGLSGALFQIITRNPLGSPDVLGFTTGAFTGSIVVLLTGVAGYFATAIGALLGGLLTAAIVWALALRKQVAGFRLIIAGIGVTALLQAVNTVLITRADDRDALTAAIWGAGSLNGVEAFWIAPIGLMLLACAVAAAALRPALAVSELGEDTSAGLGVRSSRLRSASILIGVVLISGVTAVAGPIAFVALAAPQLARALWRTGAVPLGGAAATGALLLVGSDLVAQRLIAPTILPTGVVTICIGGAYLAWALTRKGPLS